MKKSRRGRLGNKYAPLLMAALLILNSFMSLGQYNPSACCTVSNKSYGMSQAGPTDGRSEFWDPATFLYRKFNSRAEALSYLTLTKYRTGYMPIFIDSIGQTWMYWFRNGTADSNLVLFSQGPTGCSGCLLAANNLSDVANVPAAMSNLGLGSMATLNSTAGGDLNGVWPSITVQRFNGQLPSYYLNYLNLVNPPAIPAQLNPTGIGLVTITGSYPNLTWTGRTPGIEETIFQNNAISRTDSINIGSFLFRFFGTSAVGLPNGTTAQRPGSPGVGDTRYNTDSLAQETWNGSAWVSGPGGGGGGGITAGVGDVSFAGSGTVTTTLATVNSNTFGSNTFLKFAVNAKGLTTSATAVVNSDIVGALGYTPYNATNPNGYIPLTALSVAAPLSYNNTTGAFAIQVANTSQNGYLSSTDWNTFNGKQVALSGTGYLKFSGTTPSYLTPTQVTADLNVFTSLLQGLVPASGGGTTNFLRADGTWATPGGGGTVTSFSAGNLSPLFTTSVATATTTPALSFALSNASANTAFGNFTGSSAAPSFGKLPLGAMATGTANYLIGYDGSGNPVAIKPDTLKVQQLGVGDSVGYLATDTLKLRLIRDSLAFHHVTNPDGSWTFYAASGGGGTIGGSVSAGQVAFGTASNTIGSESAFIYDSATNKVSTDSLGIKSINADATSFSTVQYPFSYKMNYAGYGGMRLQNVSFSGAAVTQLLITNNAGELTGGAIELNVLGSNFAGGATVMRMRGPQPFVLANDSNDIIIENGIPGVSAVNRMHIFNWSGRVNIGNDGANLGYNTVGPHTTFRVLGSGTFTDTLKLCDNAAGGYATILAQQPADSTTFQRNNGIQFLGQLSGNLTGYILAKFDPGGTLTMPGYPNTYSSGGYTTKAFIPTNSAGLFGVQNIYDTASGTRNSGGVLYWNSTGTTPTSGSLTWDATNKTLNAATTFGGKVTSDSIRLYKGYVLLNDEGHNYTFFKNLNFGNGSSYVEGVGFRFQTITQANSAVDAFRIDSGGIVKIPQAPPTATSADSVLFWSSSTAGAIKKMTISSLAGLLTSTNIYNADGTLTGNRTLSGANFSLALGTSGSKLSNLSAWSTQGVNFTGGQYNNNPGSQLLMSTSTINNPVTAASGSVSNLSAYFFSAPTITSTNASVTYTTPATLRIENAPTMSTNSTSSGGLYALDVAAGISHFGVGTSNFSAVMDGTLYINGATKTNTVALGLSASTTNQTTLNIPAGVDPTGGSVNTASGNMWYNGANLYFVDGTGTGVGRDLLNGLHNYKHTIFTPATGGTVNLSVNQYNIINPSGAIATLTVNLPSSPNNNDVVYIKYTQAVTSVTYGNGTVIDGITAPTAGGLVVLTYDAGTSSWY